MTQPTQHRSSFERWLGVILIALSIASVIFVAIQTQRLSDATECQAQYNDAYTKALQERTNAARNERQAQRTYLTALLNPHTTQAQARAASDQYLSSLDAADREREAAAIPTRRCQ